MNFPQKPTHTQNSNSSHQQDQKLRTWPLVLIALAGLVAAISLILIVPQYLKAPLSELQSNLIQNSLDTPPSTQITPPAQVSASLSASDAPQYKVTRVVDGDTIVVNINGQDEKIRLIGVNTPESVDPRKPVECFGKEASNYTKSLLENQNILLESDPTQGDKDKYGRLLRYIHLPNPTTTENPSTTPTAQPAASQSAPPAAININLKLIQDGYAHEYTYSKPYKYQSQFKQAQIQAENTQKGLWSTTACGTP